jgi:hypothetical protein
MLTPALDLLFIAYNTGAAGRILHTICIGLNRFAVFGEATSED